MEIFLKKKMLSVILLNVVNINSATCEYCS